MSSSFHSTDSGRESVPRRKTPLFRHGPGFFGMAREFFPKAWHTKVAWSGPGGTLLCRLSPFSGEVGTRNGPAAIPVADWRANLSDPRGHSCRKTPHFRHGSGFSAWLWRFFRKLGTRKWPGVPPVALCRADCPHFRAKLAHGIALQLSQWPIGVRTFRNRGATRAEKHPIFGMGLGFSAWLGSFFRKLSSPDISLPMLNNE